MIKIYTLLLLVCLFVSPAIGQKKYITSGGELILSWASANQKGADVTTITRFSPVFNIQTQFHLDRSDKFGFFTGINLRNVGFIYDDPYTANTRYKVRNYTLGIPLALKLGDMNGFFLFGGYEIELPFNFKQKQFVNEEKVDKFNVWFSKRTPAIYQSLFAGLQTPQGIQLKFKYYLTNFFNKNYSSVDSNGVITEPYKDFSANVFYVSISAQILKGTKFYHTSATQQARN